MAKYASKVVEQAVAWLGLKESDGSHKKIVDTYNSHKPLARGYALQYSDSWCAGFVSAVAIKLGYTSIIPPEVSCNKMIELLKKQGTWIENENRTPKPGEIIFYDWDDSGAGDNKGSSDHVGIVETVSGGNITVIEGNYSNAVKRRTLKVNGRYIRGYGVPKYDAEPAAETTKTLYRVTVPEFGTRVEAEKLLTQLKAAGITGYITEVPVTSDAPAAAKKSVEEIAREVLAGKWGNGTDRKNRIIAAGYDYNAVQAAVNKLLK